MHLPGNPASQPAVLLTLYGKLAYIAPAVACQFMLPYGLWCTDHTATAALFVVLESLQRAAADMQHC